MEVIKKKQEKKPTAAQLERRLKNATLHLDKTKDTIEVYFDDKGLRLTVDENEGYAIIATNYHRHVFNAYTISGISKPFLYTKRIIELANENDCTIKDERGNVTRSYERLRQVLKEKGDQDQIVIVHYYDMYLFNIFSPLYEIGESVAETFFVLEDYAHNIARNNVLLSEHKEDVTNKEFIKSMREWEDSAFGDMTEEVILKKMSDEERMKQEVEALQEQEMEQTMEEQVNGEHE